MTKLLASAVALLFIAQADCLAQEQQSFRSLMARGYDIKSVTFVKGESTENREVFVVTLQRERSVAVQGSTARRSLSKGSCRVRRASAPVVKPAAR